MDNRTAWLFAGAVWCLAMLSIGFSKILLWRLRRKIAKLGEVEILHDRWVEAKKTSDQGTRVIDLDLHDEG